MKEEYDLYQGMENIGHWKQELMELFKDFPIITHTNEEQAYEYLGEGDVELEILQPKRGGSLFIEITGEFTLSFGDWHMHYYPDLYYFSELKKDALAIVRGEYGMVSVLEKGQWRGATLLREKISPDISGEALIKKLGDSALLQGLKGKVASFHIEYWGWQLHIKTGVKLD